MRKFIHMHAVTRSRLIIGGDYNCVLNANDRVSGVTDRSRRDLGDAAKETILGPTGQRCYPQTLD